MSNAVDEARARRSTGFARHLRVSFGVSLALMCFVLAGCPGHSSNRLKPGPPPTIDAAAALRADAAALRFPIRLPQLPGDWQATSAKRGHTIDAKQSGVSKIDYIVPGGARISLFQSDAKERPLMEYVDTAGSLEESLQPTGRQEVDGVTWRTWRGANHKDPVWSTELGVPDAPQQIAITGSAGADAYRMLAAAVQTQPPLPVA